MNRSFVEPDFAIVVIAHASSRESSAVVDQLAITELDGDQAKAAAFLEELKKRYLGKPVDDWLSE